MGRMKVEVNIPNYALAEPDRNMVSELGQARASALEIGLETKKRISNARLEFIKRLYDRRPFGEQYLKLNCELHIHFLSRNGMFCARCSAGEIEEPDSIRVREDRNLDRTAVGNELTVLVGIREVPEGSRPVASSIRLQRLDSCYMGGIESIEPAALFPERETLSLVFNRKLSAIKDFSRIEESKLIDEIIEGRSQIIADFPNYYSPFKGDFDMPINDELRFAEMIRVFIPFPATGVFLLLPKCSDQFYDLKNVFACPRSSGVSTAQRCFDGVSH